MTPRSPKHTPTPRPLRPKTKTTTPTPTTEELYTNNVYDICILEDENGTNDSDSNSVVNSSSSSTTTPPPPPAPPNHPIHEDDDDDPLATPHVNLTKPFTEKEKKFLAIYLSGRVSRERALRLAGYKIKDKAELNRIGNRILEKHVRRVDLRQILRSVGLSEIRIAKMILQIAEDLSNTAKVRLAALELAAKIMGMTRDQDTGYQGAEIVIEAGTEVDRPQQADDQDQEQARHQPARVAVRARMRTVTR